MKDTSYLTWSMWWSKMGVSLYLGAWLLVPTGGSRLVWGRRRWWRVYLLLSEGCGGDDNERVTVRLRKVVATKMTAWLLEISKEIGYRWICFCPWMWFGVTKWGCSHDYFGCVSLRKEMFSCLWADLRLLTMVWKSLCIWFHGGASISFHSCWKLHNTCITSHFITVYHQLLHC